ncbi:MAG: hypothetical protein JXR36_00395 [Bacteroidales bacterium]|nr:hypothetical protein [Bacteroidales bacterium]
MILYFVGISCVGKTTIGKLVAQKLGFSFFDLDLEIQYYYGSPIERIQDECLTMNDYRKKGSVVLDMLFSKHNDCVIAGTPSGLKFSYLKVYRKHKKKDLISICLKDSHVNVLNRLEFYDKDSNPIIEIMDDYKRAGYLNKIREDCEYFKNSYMKADLLINIKNLSLEEISDLIIDKISFKTKS